MSVEADAEPSCSHSHKKQDEGGFVIPESSEAGEKSGREGGGEGAARHRDAHPPHAAHDRFEELRATGELFQNTEFTEEFFHRWGKLLMEMTPKEQRIFLFGHLQGVLRESAWQHPHVENDIPFLVFGKQVALSSHEFWALHGHHKPSWSAISRVENVEFPHEGHENQPHPHVYHTDESEEQMLREYLHGIVKMYAVESSDVWIDKRVAAPPPNQEAVHVLKMPRKFSIAMFHRAYERKCRDNGVLAFSVKAFRARLFLLYPQLRLSATEFGSCTFCAHEKIAIDRLENAEASMRREILRLNDQINHTAACGLVAPEDEARLAQLVRQRDTMEAEAQKAAEEKRILKLGLKNHEACAMSARNGYNRSRETARVERNRFLSLPQHEREMSQPSFVSLSIDAAKSIGLPFLSDTVPTKIGVWDVSLSLQWISVVDEGGGITGGPPAPLLPQALPEGAHDAARHVLCNYFIQTEAAGSMNSDVVISVLLFHLFNEYKVNAVNPLNSLEINLDNAGSQVCFFVFSMLFFLRESFF